MGTRTSRRRFLARSGGALAFAATCAALPPGASFAAAPDPEASPARVLEQFRALCLETARANIVDGQPIPSRAYQHGTWLRDGYWTLAALGDPDLQRRTWQRFAGHQNPEGQVPSSLLHDEQVYYAAEDESAVFFVLLALDLQRAGIEVERTPLEGAARYLRSRLSPVGQVESGPGPFTWWLDTLILAQRDTVAYNQGLWAVALRALPELGFPNPPGLLDRVEQSYAALYRPDLGTMPLSAHTTLLDVSCLVGEHLSLRYFDRKLLDDDVVAATLRTFRRVDYPDGSFLGFAVATQYDGQHMPLEWFHPAPDNWPGYYHNGGSWLLYDALALDAGRKHGVAEAADLLQARIRAETKRDHTLHEYLATNPALGHLGTAPFEWRKDYAWNSYVATLL